MPTPEEVRAALRGTLVLARLDEHGLAYFDRSLGGFWRSFFAAVLIAPFYLLMVVTARSSAAAGVEPLYVLAIETISYAVRWLVYPFAMLWVVDLLDRRERFFEYMVPYNWANVPQAVVLVAVTLFNTGVIGGAVGQFLWFVTLSAVLFYSWFIAKVGLRISGLQAVALVLLDNILTIAIGAISQAMVRG